MTDRPIRASDQERESVVDVLRDAFTEGRLTADELEERTAAAYAAKTRGQLGELTIDLPVQPPLGADLSRGPHAALSHGPHARPAPPGTAAARAHQSRRRRPYDRLLPVLVIWILIAAAAGAPSLAAALSFVFICLLACRIGYGGRW
jgi:DUF1707 SHOCT-like domain